MKAGLFVTLEGGEGTGKSTLSRALIDALKARGHSVTATREPGGSRGGELIRSMALFPPADISWSLGTTALLMSAARRDHVEKLIKPALQEGRTVISDRFFDSTFAYQGGQDGLSDSELLQLEDLTTSGLRPDLTVLLDAAPGDLLIRRQGRGPEDVFERSGLAFHENVRTRFLKRAKQEPQRFLVMDALERPEDLARRALAAIESRISTHAVHS